MAKRNTTEGKSASTSDHADEAMQAYLDYTDTLREGGARMAKASADAYTNYVKRVQDAFQDVGNRIAEVLKTYVEEVSAAWSSGEAYEAAHRGLASYSRTLGNLGRVSDESEAEQLRTSYQDLLAELARAVSDPDPKPRSEQAYTNYVEQVQSLLGRTEEAKHVHEAGQAYGQQLKQYCDAACARQKQAYERMIVGLEEISDAAARDDTVQACHNEYGEAITRISKQLADLYSSAAKKAADVLGKTAAVSAAPAAPAPATSK